MSNVTWNYVEPLKAGQDISFLELEIKYHYQLPDDLRNCIKLNNGGIPDKSKFDTQDNTLVFGGLLSFNEDGTDTVYSYIPLFETEGNTVEMFPFGLDPFGNLFCMENGKVVLYNHEEDTATILAETFTEFIEKLY